MSELTLHQRRRDPTPAELAGIPFPELITRLVELALERDR